MSEVKYAVRRLWRTPTFSTAVLLVLAILIGATASIFALVDGVVFKSFDVEQPSRLMVVWESSEARHMPQFAVAPANYLDWQRHNTTFTDIAASGASRLTVRVHDAPPERVAGATATPNYFRVLGTRPRLGRLPRLDAGEGEILISSRYWRRAFDESAEVIGQIVDVNDQPKTIVGVLPPGASSNFDVWRTLQFNAAEAVERDRHFLVAIGRLKPGVTQSAAQANLATISARLATEFPTTNRGWTVRLVPVVEQLVGSVRPALMLLLLAGICTLLVGAANLTNLFLARGEARSHDLALRSAIGASRSRIVGELVAESVILTLLGGALGVGLSAAGVRMVKVLAPSNLPRLSDVSVDGRTAIFCLAAAATMILIFGLLPALRLSNVSLSGLVREGSRTGRSKRGVQLQDTLVITQVIVSVALLTTALLFLEAFNHFRQLDQGFRAEGVLTAEISVPRSRYRTPEQQGAFAASVRQQLLAQPGVLDATVSAALPSMNAGNGAFFIVGKPLSDPSRAPIATTNAVDAGYFGTLGIHLLRGRGFTASDSWRSPKVVVIDELLAKRYFAGEDPVGRQVAFLGTADTSEIVGVVGTVKEHGLAADDVPTMYFPFSQWPTNELTVALRGTRAPESYAPVIRRVVNSLDANAPVSGLLSLDERMMQTVAMTRFAAFLASVFAIVAVLLGTIGVYAVLAFGVVQRRREFAIRLALGAERRSVIGGVLRKSLGLTGAGVAIGLVATWVIANGLSALLVGADAHDLRTFIAAGVMMVLVGLVAAVGPAIRSVGMNLVSELRS